MSKRQLIVIAFLLSALVGCNGRYDSGDRVLVTKFSYDIGLTPPNRYDVVVFKFPKTPVENGTPKNFIKRLLGLPGEIIAIFFGRLYRWAPEPGAPPPYDDVNGKKIHPNELWTIEHTHKNDEKARRWFQEGKFEILRKPPHVMLAMRRIVYDNDFQAADLKKIGFPERWTPSADSSWQKDQGTGFASTGKAAEQVDWLRYQHLVRPDGPLAGGPKVEPMLILDSLGYNMFHTFGHNENDPPSALREKAYGGANWVGDLMVECDLEVAEPKGEFWFELSKGHDRFRARWNLADGQCTLFRVGKDGTTHELASQPTSVKSAGKYMLRLANIDARLTIWVNGELPFGDGHEYDPPEILSAKDLANKLTWEDTTARRGPTANDLEPASVGVKAAPVKVSRLRVWRDTYYRANTNVHPTTDFNRSDMSRDAWSTPESWNALRGEYRFATMYVQPGHYLCLGDNSEASDDSRNWGVVPERLMLGRALLVYYPINRIGPIR